MHISDLGELTQDFLELDDKIEIPEEVEILYEEQFRIARDRALEARLDDYVPDAIQTPFYTLKLRWDQETDLLKFWKKYQGKFIDRLAGADLPDEETIEMYGDFFSGWQRAKYLTGVMDSVSKLMDPVDGYGVTAKKNIDMMGFELLRLVQQEMAEHYKKRIIKGELQIFTKEILDFYIYMMQGNLTSLKRYAPEFLDETGELRDRDEVIVDATHGLDRAKNILWHLSEVVFADPYALVPKDHSITEGRCYGLNDYTQLEKAASEIVKRLYQESSPA